MTDPLTAMRIQATALMVMIEKQGLDELAKTHKTTLSVILRAGFHQFKENPESQKAWMEVAKQVSKEATG